MSVKLHIKKGDMVYVIAGDSRGQQGRAQQNRRAPFEKMPHPRHSKSPLFAPYKEKLCSVPSHYTSRPDGMQRIGGEC